MSVSPPRLVNWQKIELTLRGERIAALVGEEIRRRAVPITQLTLQFDEGSLLAEGKLQKGFGIPFTVLIRRIDASGHLIRIRLDRTTAFGIPLPSVLLKIAQTFIPPGEIRWDEASQSFEVRLDRFLPSFIDVDLSEVRLIAGGVSVRLGAGGADPPPQH
jgi:hypothetical protein